MTQKRVIVYYMHEYEMAEFSKHLRDTVWASSFAMGTMSENAIQAITNQGILVEVIEDSDESTEQVTWSGVELTASGHGRSIPAGEPLEPTFDPLHDNVYAIEIDGPFLMPAWHENLAKLGAELIERLQDGRYTSYLSVRKVEDTQKLPFVKSVRLLSPQDSGIAFFSNAATGRVALQANQEKNQETVFDVLLHRRENMSKVEKWLKSHKIQIVASGRRKIRVELALNSDKIRQIEALPEVRQISEYVEPKLANDTARRMLGLESFGNPGTPVIRQTGKGEIVAVADSGFDDTHPDFQGRLVALIARARPNDPSDLHGHGTHVAGSILGNGTASNGIFKGTAPDANLFFQSIMDKSGKLSGLPIDLNELFAEAYSKGARIHNNSWSADTKAFYTLSALEVDEFVDAHPDMLITIAAGNEGSAANPFSSQRGFVDWQSIGSPATAKNALTVGASRSEKAQGGFATMTYNAFNAQRFPDPPIASENVSGDGECLAAFSARGPCDPRRIKPDVVAPGTDIVSAKSRIAPNSSFWGMMANNNKYYAYLGGTSMATPLVSGCAAIVRQFFREECNYPTPSAALVKATLINGTRRLKGQDALADHSELPNYHQGFGAVHVPFTIPNNCEPWMRLEFLDTKSMGGGFEAGRKDRTRVAFRVQGGQFLRVCLVWTDRAAGASLQNILGIILEHSGLTPPKRMGNEHRPQPLGRLDRDNNVQVIRLENPPPGDYLLQIFAANLLGPQQWALVVTGDIAPGLVEI